MPEAPTNSIWVKIDAKSMAEGALGDSLKLISANQPQKNVSS